MSIFDLLTMLKTDLGISTVTAYDTRLTQYLTNAILSILREGATVATESNGAYTVSTVEDAELIVMYAAWTWRKRDSGEGMPRMLRYALNNRIFSEKMQDEDDE